MLHPLNKYLVVTPCETVETGDNTTILVPDDVQFEVAPFKVVELLGAHADSNLYPGMCLVVPSHSLEQVNVRGKEYHIVLESHVVATVSDS